MVQRTVLHYQLVEKIGVGGMGEIYKARDTRLNRFVAMKVMSAGSVEGSEDRRLRFIQEAQAVSALNHPNIITIYDVVHDDSTQYMVVEYLDGKTLLELIPKGGLPIPLVVKYATQMAEALTAAHAAGIVHRDLKPANVMVTGNGWVKVLDFGLAKLIDWTQADPDAATVTLQPSPLTIEGTLLGTVNYMSPEQAEGKRVDARSDIFSFGAVLYEMITGQAAFRGDSVVSTLSAVLRDEVRPVRELVPEAPAELERVIGACLKKDPEQRVQSIGEVRDALNVLRLQMDSGALSDIATPAQLVPPRAIHTNRGIMPMVAAAVVVTALGAGGYFWWMHRPRPVSDHPRTAAATAAPPAPAEKDVPTGTPTGVLTNKDVFAMSAGNIAPATIIAQIRASKTNFDLSPEQLIGLTKAGVSADVIAAMRDPRGTAPPTPTVNPAVPASFILDDGLAIHLNLAEDIPLDATEGDPVRFKVASDVRVDDTVVIKKGASAVGAIVDAPKKKLLVLGGKMTFRIDRVDAVDGQKVALRALPVKREGVASKRPLDSGTGAKKPKDVAAAAGTAYIGYVDGTKTLTLKR